MGRNKIPMIVSVGVPIQSTGGIAELDGVLRQSMTELLHKAQLEYAHPAGAYWVPRRLGGTAPTMDEAKRRDEAELAERARKRAARDAKNRR
jgi:glycyl-tRNA synthetase beta subunit